jgi:hypothetical protein
VSSGVLAIDLDWLVRAGDPAAAYTVEHGVEYAWRPYDAERYGPKGLFRQCFRNAWNLSHRHPELTYVEGFGSNSAGIPLHHAWTIDEDGFVQDPTWREPGDTTCGYCLGDGCERCVDGYFDYSQLHFADSTYVGVPFTPAQVAEALLEQGCWAILTWKDLPAP